MTWDIFALQWDCLNRRPPKPAGGQGTMGDINAAPLSHIDQHASCPTGSIVPAPL